MLLSAFFIAVWFYVAGLRVFNFDVFVIYYVISFLFISLEAALN